MWKRDHVEFFPPGGVGECPGLPLENVFALGGRSLDLARLALAGGEREMSRLASESPSCLAEERC